MDITPDPTTRGANPRRARWWVVALGLAVTLAFLSAGCGSDDSDDAQASDDTAESDDDALRCVTDGEDVDWSRSDYAGMELETRIGQMACAADCAGLQAELDLANDNAAAVRVNYPGEGNDALISTLDATMSELGC